MSIYNPTISRILSNEKKIIIKTDVPMTRFCVYENLVYVDYSVFCGIQCVELSQGWLDPDTRKMRYTNVCTYETCVPVVVPPAGSNDE